MDDRRHLATGPGSEDAPFRPAPRSARGSRWERQHVAIVRLVLDGELVRAAGLAREHLGEFPGDVVVRYAVTRYCADVDDLVVGAADPDSPAAASNSGYGVAAPRSN